MVCSAAIFFHFLFAKDDVKGESDNPTHQAHHCNTDSLTDNYRMRQVIPAEVARYEAWKEQDLGPQRFR